MKSQCYSFALYHTLLRTLLVIYKPKTILKSTIAFIWFCIFIDFSVYAQIAKFNFPASNSLAVSAKDPNVTVTNFSLSTGTIEANITTGAYFPNEPYIEESGGWTATTQATAKNFNFTINAASGYQFTITNISFRAYATSAGPSAFGFAVGNMNLFSTNALDGSLVTVNQAVTGQTNLTTATIKIQGWLNGSRTSNGGGTFRLDDVIISGTVSLIAAPSLSVDTKTITGTYPNFVSGGENILGSNITKKGILWSTSNDPTLTSNNVGGSYTKQATNEGSGTSNYLSNFAALNPGTTYYYRAYVVDNSGNIAYGVSKSMVVPAISGDLLAFWDFGPNAAGYSNSFTYKNPALTGTPTITQSGGTMDSNGKDGVDYQNSAGTSVRGQGMAWDDAKNGTTAQWIVQLNTSSFENLHLRADYKLQTAGTYTLSYNTSAGWIPITSTGNLIANNIDNDYNWGTIYHDLSSIAAFGNASTVQLRFTINDVSGGANDELIFDNIEVFGTCITPIAPLANFNYSPSNPACGTITLTYTGTPASLGSTYYWQTSSSGTSTANPITSPQIINATGYRWLRALNSCGTWSSATSTDQLVIQSDPSISNQPSDQSAFVGESASFSVVASNVNSYQWQIDSGSGWTDIVGANASTYTTPATTLTMDGYLYRCIISGTTPCGTTQSNAVSLTVTDGPCLSQPTFTALPTDWSQTSISYSLGEAIFSANTGQLTTLAVSNPSLLTFDLRRTNNTTAKSLIVEISTTTQGGTYTPFFMYDHSNTTSNATTSISLDLSAYNAETTVFIRFRKASNTTSPWFLKNVMLTCGTEITCTPQIVVSEVRPAITTVNSVVQVEVNNSALIDEILFEGNSIPFTVIDETSIELIVPNNNIGTADVTLIETSTCETTTSVQIISTAGTCSDLPSTYTDLFISEIYDSYSNNVWNIELFNPTPNPILLTGVYQIKRAGDISTPASIDRVIDLVGTVPPFSTFTISAGSSGQPCNTVSFNMTESGNGINESDVITLVKNTVIVDVVHAPNEAGYSLRRNVVIGHTVPTASYTATQWTVNSNESCSNLGVFSTVFSIIDATNPSDISGCNSIDFSISSTTNGVTYQWYFNNPTTMTGWNTVNSTNLPGLSITGNTTASLSISGSVGALDGYQFYCIVTSGSCGKITQAARFHFNGQRYYRSVQSGNWTNAANWEMSNDKITYSAACNYPTSANSSEALIQSSNTLILDIDNDIDFLEIQPNATLEVLPNSTLTIYDSTANADFIVDGTFLYRSNNVNSLNLDNTATWKLGNNATLIKTNSGSATELRDQYFGGIASIPASAQWIYRYNGDGNPTVASVNMYYPNLRFENTTASPYTTSISTNSFTGNATSTVILGNLEIGTTGNGTYSFTNNNYNVSPILIHGNLQIGAGSIFTNAPLAEAGTGIELKGNLTVDGTLQLTEGLTERVLRFSGNTNQTINGTGNIHVFKIEVNKSAGNIVLNRDLQALNSLKMVAGNILTNSHLLELGVSTAQKGNLDYTAGFVIGKMRRWFESTNNDDATGLFPMGQNDNGYKNRFARVFYTTAPSFGGHLTVEFIPIPITGTGFPIPANNTGGFNQDVINPGSQGYWQMDNQTGKLNDGFHTISLTGEGFPTVTDINDITIIKRVGGGDWYCPGTHLSVSGTAAMPTLTRSDVVGWSNYGFGGGSANPLPVELITFQGWCNDGKTELMWSTASENNADRFIIESSRDMIHWNWIGEIQAAGNSGTYHAYSFTKSEKQRELRYYRLKQIDFNGDFNLYDPISLKCGTSQAEISLFPNPNQGSFAVKFNSPAENNQTKFQITDQTGRIVYQQTIEIQEGENETYINANQLSVGMYWLHIHFDGSEDIRIPFNMF